MHFQIFSLLVLLAIGFIFGRWLEARHYKSIIFRENILNRLPAIATKYPPTDKHYKQVLVTGNVVISVDYFKRFLASLRLFFGGRLSSYETLVDRARREAILRMKVKAKNKKAQYVFNIKIETASISKGARDTIGSVEVLAYGTALIPESTDVS